MVGEVGKAEAGFRVAPGEGERSVVTRRGSEVEVERRLPVPYWDEKSSRFDCHPGSMSRSPKDDGVLT